MRPWLVDENGEIFPRGYPNVEFWVKVREKPDKEMEDDCKKRKE